MDFLSASIMYWRMKVLIALLALWMAAVVEMAVQLNCANLIVCSCGSTDKNITVCQQNDSEDEPCRKYAKCKTCQDGLDRCLHCEDGFEGPLCSTPTSKIRQKRQYYYHRRRPNVGYPINYCPDLEAPKLGSIRCVSNSEGRSCNGNCLPGYSFEGYELQEEIILTCSRGEWTPMGAFPPCASGGHCDLVVEGSGSFNCTTRMTGTLCDAICYGQYAGRYFCYPGQPWTPSLPSCIRPKGISKDQPICRCQNGGNCDSNGNCVCPEGRTGTFCETIIPEKQKCHDPGFISNGFRSKSDGSRSDVRQIFEEGDYVMYACSSEKFELQGYPLLSCRSDGWWSGDLPKCTAKPDLKLCSVPGEISNGKHHYKTPPHWRGFLQGMSVEFSCNDGYDLVGKNRIYCLDSGEWSDSLPTCLPETINYCPNPGSIANGRVVLIESLDERRSRPPDPIDDLEDDFPEGSHLEYSCDRGYDIEGVDIITCKTSGQWSAKPPKCISVGNPNVLRCRNPGSILNGRVDVFPPGAIARSTLSEEILEYPEGTRLQYICDDGYFLQGSKSLRCQSTGYWSTDIRLQKCVADCGRSFVQTTHRVTGGERTINGDWPWVVAIVRMENNYPAIICGGVLINSQTVLTAAHCLDSSKTYNLYFGTTNPRREYEGRRQSTAMIVYPGYNNDSYDSDIGLIKFSPKIAFSQGIQPICLPTGESTANNFVTGKMGHVAGWGYTELDMQSSDLLHASLPYLSNEECIESYRSQNISLNLTTNMFCAGHESGSQSTCNGDSGSGLVFKDRLTLRYTVEGVVSFGVEDACGLAGRFQVFTKIVRFLDWIYKNWK